MHTQIQRGMAGFRRKTQEGTGIFVGRKVRREAEERASEKETQETEKKRKKLRERDGKAT